MRLLVLYGLGPFKDMLSGLCPFKDMRLLVLQGFGFMEGLEGLNLRAPGESARALAPPAACDSDFARRQYSLNSAVAFGATRIYT